MAGRLSRATTTIKCMCTPAGRSRTAFQCASMPFNQTVIPPSVPQKKESTWSSPDFKPPLKTFFTVANDDDIQKRAARRSRQADWISILRTGLFRAGGIPHCILSLKSGQVYRVKLGANGACGCRRTDTAFQDHNRYRDIAINPTGRTIYLVNG